MADTSAEGVWEFVQAMNDTWVSGKPAQLERYFHPDMVILAPDGVQRLEGREACVWSYCEFCANTKVQWFNTSDAHVDVFGETAVVSYALDLTYEWNDQVVQDHGKELLVLAQHEGGWRAIWRTLIPNQTPA